MTDRNNRQAAAAVDGKTDRKKFETFLNRPLLHIRDGTHRLMIGMVGLPARGKSYIAMKCENYLRWLGYKCKVFNLGQFRKQQTDVVPSREFEPIAQGGYSLQAQNVIDACLAEIKQFYAQGGQAAIFDAHNSTIEARRQIAAAMKARGSNDTDDDDEVALSMFWIESIVTDTTLQEETLNDFKDAPDYELPKEGTDENVVIRNKVKRYTETYETMTADELDDQDGYVKLINTGEQIQTHGIRGYLPTRLVFFLMNLHLHKVPIWFSRHGESEYNVESKIGGDSDLSENGREYAKRLAKFMNDDPEVNSFGKDLQIWCSTLRRTISTAGEVYEGTQSKKVVKWRALAEINAGIYDGMTYDEIKEIDPEGFEARRKDKLNYKYPQGESYKDVIDRVERVIFELERVDGPVLVVAHQAILRCLLGYFLCQDVQDIPMMKVPLHTVIKITPKAFGTTEERFQLLETTGHEHK